MFALLGATEEALDNEGVVTREAEREDMVRGLSGAGVHPNKAMRTAVVEGFEGAGGLVEDEASAVSGSSFS